MNIENLGEYLKNKREEKGLTIQQVANETKIQKMYLRAIEEQNFEELPEATYVKGFLKSYAKTIGVDPQEVLDVYVEMINEKKKDLYEEIEETENESNVKKIIIIAVLILIVFFVAVKVVGFFFADTDSEKTKSEKIERNIEEKTKLVKTENGTVVEAIEFKELEIIALNKTWIEIKDEKNSNNNFRGYLLPDQNKVIKTKNNLKINMQDGYNIKIMFNGKDLGRQADKEGEAVRKEF